MKIASYNNFNKLYSKPQNKQIFKGFDCKEFDFEIKNLYELPCPVCSITMLQRNQIDNFVNTAQNAKGEELISILSKYRKYFHQKELNAADILSFEAQKHPNKNIAELAQIYLDENLSKYRQQQEYALERAKKIATNLPTQYRKKAHSILEEYETKLKNNGNPNKKAVIQALNGQIQCEYSTKKKIIKAIQNMPDIEDDNLEFFIKYAQKSQAEIASRLVTPSFITCDHIKPKSKGGKDNTENYLAECEECNSKRTNTPLLQWVGNIPNFIQNLKNYFDVVASKIQSGEVSEKYSTYLEDVSKTIAEETKGKVKINPPQIENIENTHQNNIEEKILQIEQALKKQLKDLEDAKKLRVRIKQNEQFELISEYLALKSRRGNLEIQRKAKKDEVNKKKSFLNKYYNKLSELEKRRKELENKNLTTREKENIKIQINKIKSFLDSKNPKALNEQLVKAQKELAEIQNNLRETENRINAIKEKIDFPDDIKRQIELLKNQLYEIESIEKEIIMLDATINENQDILQRIKGKEAQIQVLLQENQNTNISESNEDDLDTYQKMTEVIKRAEEIKKDNKTPRIDSLIYELAKQKAEEVISKLTETNGSVRIQRNLDKISNMLKDLNNDYNLLNKKQIAESKRKELIEKLNSLTPKEEIESEIDMLTQKLEEIKVIFDSININARIENLEKSAEQKRRMLSRIKAAKTENEIQQLLFEL